MDNTASSAINKDGIMKLKELSGRDDTTFEVLDFSTISNVTTESGPKPEKQNKKGKAGQTQGVKLTAEEKKKKKELE